MTHLIASGAFERFPGLRFVLTEQGGVLVWRIRDSRVLRSTEFALVGPVVPSEGVGVDGLL